MSNALPVALTPATLAISLFDHHIKPLLTESPRLDRYPPILVGSDMPNDTWHAIWHACRAYRYDAQLEPAGLEGSTRKFFVHLTRMPEDHERLDGDDYPPD